MQKFSQSGGVWEKNFSWCACGDVLWLGSLYCCHAVYLLCFFRRETLSIFPVAKTLKLTVQPLHEGARVLLPSVLS